MARGHWRCCPFSPHPWHAPGQWGLPASRKAAGNPQPSCADRSWTRREPGSLPGERRGPFPHLPSRRPGWRVLTSPARWACFSFGEGSGTRSVPAGKLTFRTTPLTAPPRLPLRRFSRGTPLVFLAVSVRRFVILPRVLPRTPLPERVFAFLRLCHRSLIRPGDGRSHAARWHVLRGAIALRRAVHAQEHQGGSGGHRLLVRRRAGAVVPLGDRSAPAREIRPELPARPARLSLSVRPHAQEARGGVRGPARERADEG